MQVYVHDKKLTVGRLTVSLLECSRLPEVDGAFSVYCTLSVGMYAHTCTHMHTHTQHRVEPL